MTFAEEIGQVVNKYSRENASNTPDYILAMYLERCLEAFDTAVQQRETWYGRDARPCVPPLSEKEIQDAEDYGPELGGEK